MGASIKNLKASLLLVLIFKCGVSIASAQCTLYVNEQLQENTTLTTLWESIGYNIEPVKNLEDLPQETYAKFLTDTSFALKENALSYTFEMSIHNGINGRHWLALSNKVSKNTKNIDKKALSCESVKNNLKRQKRKQRATLSAIQHYKGEESRMNWGETILEMERFDVIGRKDKTVDYKKAKEKYTSLLSDVKKWVPKDSNLFFKTWKKVMEIVYDDNGHNIDYCGQKTLLTQALVAKCTNCVGETSLFASLFVDAGFQAPERWKLGFQVFRDHIRPVLYNSKEEKTYDLVYGSYGKAKAAILPIKHLWPLALRNQRQYPLSKINRSALNKISAEYLYSETICLPTPFDIGYIGRTQLYDLSGIKNCGEFEGAAPDHSDNKNRASRNEWNEDIEKSREKNFLQNTWSFVKDKINQGRGINPEQKSQKLVKRNKEKFKEIAENLIESEKQIFLKSIEKGRLTKEFRNKFSTKNWLNSIKEGLFSKIIKNPHQDEDYNIEFPIYIITENFESFKDIQEFYKNTEFQAVIPPDSFGKTFPYLSKPVYIKSKKIRDEILKMNSQKRITAVYKLILEDINNFRQKIETTPLYDESLSTTIENLTNPDLNLFLLNYNNSIKYMRLFTQHESPVVYSDRNSGFLSHIIPFIDFVGIGIQILKAKKQITENFVEALKILSTLDSTQLKNIEFFIYRLNNIDYTQSDYVSNFIDKELLKNNEPVFYNFLEPLFKRLLFNEHFFFTIEPDEEELKQLQLRPYFPKEILEIQSKELNLFSGYKSNLPKVNLPTIKTDACKGSKTRYIDLGFLTLDCLKAGSQKGKNGFDQRRQKGKEFGDEKPGANGNAQSKQFGTVEDNPKGYDQLGLKSSINPDLSIKNYKPLNKVYEIKDRINPQDLNENSPSLIDPRGEVHLPLKLWELVLEVHISHLSRKPQYSLGVHHAARKKMNKLLKRYLLLISSEHLNFNSIYLSGKTFLESLGLDEKDSLSSKLLFNISPFDTKAMNGFQKALKDGEKAQILAKKQGVPIIFQENQFLTLAYKEFKLQRNKNWRVVNPRDNGKGGYYFDAFFGALRRQPYSSSDLKQEYNVTFSKYKDLKGESHYYIFESSTTKEIDSDEIFKNFKLHHETEIERKIKVGEIRN